MPTEYLTVSEVARRLDCSHRSVGRAAAKHGLGIVAGGRVVAIPAANVPRVKDFIHETSGNPNWIAKAGKRKRKPA